MEDEYIKFLLKDDYARIGLEVLAYGEKFTDGIQADFCADVGSASEKSDFMFLPISRKDDNVKKFGWFYPSLFAVQPHPLCPLLGFWYDKAGRGSGLFMGLFPVQTWSFGLGENIQYRVKAQLPENEAVKEITTIVNESGNFNYQESFGGLDYRKCGYSRIEFMRVYWSARSDREKCAKAFISQCVEWWKKLEAPLRELNQALLDISGGE